MGTRTRYAPTSHARGKLPCDKFCLVSDALDELGVNMVVGKHERLLLLVIIFTSTILLGCQRGARNADLTVDIVGANPEPPIVGPAELRLRLRDKQRQTVTGLGTIEVEGTMSHAGMQPVLVSAHELQDGIFVTEGFRFTMAGDWIILARGTWNGKPFEAQAVIAGVRSGTGAETLPTHTHDMTSTP